MKLHEIREQRAQRINRMREIINGAERETRDLNEAEKTEFDRLKTEERNLSDQLNRAEVLQEAERRMQGENVTSSGDRRLDDELRNFSLLRAIASGVPDLRGKVDSGREVELGAELARRSGRAFQGIAVPLSVFHQPIERRVFTTGNPAGGPGSNIIATDHLGNQFIDRLRAAIRVRSLGATVLSGLVGNVDIPRLKGSTTAQWVAENAALTASDPQTDKVSLTPKHVGALTELSRNMIMQSSPDAEQLVRNDFAQILAAAFDGVAIQGGGSNEPTGVLGTAGIGDVPIGTNGGPITWSSIIDLIAEVEIDNAFGSAFMTNAKVVKSARKTPKVSSTDSVMVMESPTELAGYALASTNLVPSTLTKGTSSGVCSALLFGNWADLILAYWSELDILVNPFESTAYAKGNVQVRGMLTADVDVRHPESFAAIKDLTT